ncbi:hypothetical protein MUN84_04030 [Hymenobacter sp. 5516J-16]|nr:ABC transporter C-terminal domain-containing protein [Hymenobacter sp. 5516J-16]UOQ79075.1 hypothetical protein MUN84_04030 [Hymenobacter sp. 5516J-16]
MDALVEQVFALEPGGNIRQFPGNYTDYREWQKEQDAETAARPPKGTVSAAPVAAPPAPVAAPAAAKRKATFAEKKEYETLEKELEQLEVVKQQLIEKLNSGTGSHQELADWAAQLKRTDADLDSKGERWLELAEFV